MSQDVEYHDAMINMLELIWGEGFMAPGGTGILDKLVDGLDLQGKRVLDIGCGLGGPDCYLAEKYGARTTGIDIESQLIDICRDRAARRGLAQQCEFVLVEPGPLPFDDEAFDLVISSGAVTQIHDKAGLFSEMHRVLKPGGQVRSYEWTTSQPQHSEDMLYFFKMEGLTYALVPNEAYAKTLRQAGFENVNFSEVTAWYRRRVREEYELLLGDLNEKLFQTLGDADATHFLEDWRSMVVVYESGEMTQGLFRAQKPG